MKLLIGLRSIAAEIGKSPAWLRHKLRTPEQRKTWRLVGVIKRTPTDARYVCTDLAIRQWAASIAAAAR